MNHVDSPAKIAAPSAFSADPAKRRFDAGGLTVGAAAVTTGLTAGVYFAYATSVMLGLAQTDDQTFVKVMQKINQAIQNPVFFSAFFGALVLPGVGAFLQGRRGRARAGRWGWLALALYAVGFITTMAFNVPLNDQLAAVGMPAQSADLTAVRHQVEGPWIAWNAVRAVASTASLACLLRSLILHGRR